MTPRVSVLMPTHDQAAFIGRALGSLRRQTVEDWELLILDDGSRQPLDRVLAPFLGDDRVRVHRDSVHRGLGAACNHGLRLAAAPIIAYLPSDDLWDPDHLAHGLRTLDTTGAALVHSGMRHHGSARSLAPLPGYGLQLVQVLHRRTDDRWSERQELVTDDLDRMFWARVRARGPVAGTGRVTCTWQDHPDQRHKTIRARDDGGLNVFRRRYRVTTPLRFCPSDGPAVDEQTLYRHFRRRSPAPAADGLHVLLVGDLGFHPERIVQLEERGHRLSGLWTTDTLGPHTVGPLPVGHVADLDPDRWRSQIAAARPDVVYAQQNFRSVRLGHAVRSAFPDVPFLWHYKEAPQRSIARGDWEPLAALVTSADACLFASEEERGWFASALPDRCAPAGVMDGDLPSAHWGRGPASTPLRERTGLAHLACVGRPIGIDPAFVGTLAAADIHLHLHGLADVPAAGWDLARWLERARMAAPAHLHVHPHVAPDRWREVLSRYDGGLLHRVGSANGGDLAAATWDDCNLPARIGTYAAAGLPLVAPAAVGHRVAVQELIQETGVGLLYDDVDDLAGRLRARTPVVEATRDMAAHRHRFTFDHHVDRLEALLRELAAA